MLLSRPLPLLLLSVALVASSVAQSTRTGDAPTTVEAPIAVDALIASINEALRERYVFPEKAKLIASHLDQQLEKGAYKDIADRQLLAERIRADIQSVHRDGHLRVSHRSASRPRRSIGSMPQDASQQLRWARDNNFFFKHVEVLEGNIGYVKFDGFFGPPTMPAIENAIPTITAALRFVANTEEIIIDLRHNRGGSPEMVKHICSYFFAERTRLNDVYARSTGETTQGWTDPTRTDGLHLSMPIYILTSKRTFSAAEDFSYAMQATKRAQIVGETTGGGAHPVESVPVGQGFIVAVPHSRSINHLTKTNWEGTGVAADIPAPADQAMERAIQVILEGRTDKAATMAQ